MSERHPQWGQAVRLLTEADCTPELLDALSQMAGAGFANSRLLNYFANGAGTPGITLYMLALIKVVLRYGWVTAVFEKEKPVAMALWLPPGSTTVPLTGYLDVLPLIVKVAGWSTLRMLWDLWQLEKKHQEVMQQDVHLYLVTVVVDPQYRAHKLSSQLMGPAWDWCDHLNCPAYLESDDSGPLIGVLNSIRYAGYGFRSHGSVHISDPLLWSQYLAMRRDPRKVFP